MRVESSFDTIRAHARFGYEPRRGLTALLSLEYGMAEDHAVQATDRASGDELVCWAGLSYAWDLRPVAARGGEPLPPAVIGLVFDDPAPASPPEAAIRSALRQAIPRLRAATLAAEREAGGTRGVLFVELAVSPDGGVAEARVDDLTANPALARAVRDFFLGLRLPGSDRR